MLPSGIIFLWSGAIVDIPVGYFLCDGNNGTPDLRDRFVPGAGALWAVGENGGAFGHEHDFTGDGHAHNIQLGVVIADGSVYDQTTTSFPVTGTTDQVNQVPPFYALAYIMKA